MIENKVILANGEIVGTSKLKVGDLLAGPNGKTSEVLAVTKTRDEVFEITSRTGVPFYVTKDNFLCNASGSKQVQAISFVGKNGWHSNNKRNELDRADFITFPEQPELPISPYLFGILLMNSSSCFGRVRVAAKKGTYMRDAIINELLPPLNMEVSNEDTKYNKNSNSFFVHNCPKGEHLDKSKNRLIAILETLGLGGVTVPNRFIPDCYKFANVEERRELLAAIIDCSAAANGGSFEFTLASKKLAEDIVFLARSVGLAAIHRKAIKCGREYQIVTLRGEARLLLPLKNKRAVKNVNTLRKTFEINKIGKRVFTQIVTSGSYLTEDFTIIK